MNIQLVQHTELILFRTIPPQTFTFAVHLDGSLFKEGIESRYHHLYSSIDFDLTEDEKAKNILSIKSIKLTESLYKITNIGEKYTEYLAQAFIEN